MAERPDNELTVAELKFWRRFMEGMGAFDGALNRQLQADSGISHLEFGVLVSLDEVRRGRRMSDLAQRLSISPSRLTHLVGRLEDRGWVERCPSADDRRATLAVLTDEGESVMREAWSGHARLLRSILIDEIDPEERATLERIFRGLARRANEAYR